MKQSDMHEIRGIFELYLKPIEDKLDTFLTNQSDHETRLRSIEKWMWGTSGMAIVISTAISYFLKR